MQVLEVSISFCLSFCHDKMRLPTAATSEDIVEQSTGTRLLKSWCPTDESRRRSTLGWIALLSVGPCHLAGNCSWKLIFRLSSTRSDSVGWLVSYFSSDAIQSVSSLQGVGLSWVAYKADRPRRIPPFSFRHERGLPFIYPTVRF